MIRILACIIIVCLPLISLSGCQALEVQDTAIATAVAMEKQQNTFIVSAQLAIPQAAGQSGSSSGPKFIVLSKEGRSIAEAARVFTLNLPRIPLWYHASILMLGENLAKSDVPSIVDALTRNRNIRENVLVVMARGASPDQILQVETPLEPLSAVAIRRILEVQERQAGIYLPVTLEEFLQKLASPGVDPVLPQVSIKDQFGQKLLKIEGTAVFRGSRLAGELNETESRGYRFLQAKTVRGGLLIIPAPGDPSRKVTIEIINSITKVKPVIEGTQLRIKIDTQVEANFYEQTSHREILTLQNIPVLERTSAQQMEQEMRQTISKAQQYRADIFGWGRLVEISYPQVWQQVKGDWPEIFSGVEPEFKIQVNLRRSYLTDKSFVFK